MCALHDQRAKRGADLELPSRQSLPADPTCAHPDGCELPNPRNIFLRAEDGNVYCRQHRRRLQANGHLGGAKPRQRFRRGETCLVEDCERTSHSRGWCDAHYQRWRRYGDPGQADVWDRSSHGVRNVAGYVLIYFPDHPSAQPSTGYVMQHRVAMEQKLGRPLREYENVHHINGVKDDNRLENLELWVKPQPSGQRVEDLVHWVLTEYRDEVERQLSAPTLFAVGE